MKKMLLLLLISCLVSAVFLLILIPFLRKIKAGQYILSYVKEHKNKGGTPTMGGLAFITAWILCSIVAIGIHNTKVNFIVAIVFGFTIVGFLDDFLKIYRKDNEGLKPYQKIVFQLAIAVIVAIYCYVNQLTKIVIPFLSYEIDISWGIIPLVLFVFLATVNCVNLTDGLDGLAAGTSIAYLVTIVILICANQRDLAELSMIFIGVLLAFLLFNSNKASVFMGDTGSLSLGSYLTCVSVFSGRVLHVAVIGILFVVSGISVILQVIYYKRTRKRIFLMAPFHHHLQMKGFTETKISYAYFLITLLVGILCIICEV